jgi:hypothetical protein
MHQYRQCASEKNGNISRSQKVLNPDFGDFLSSFNAEFGKVVVACFHLSFDQILDRS